jgi:hypothetical protein
VSAKSDISKVAELLNGFQQSCALAAMVEVGLVDCLSRGPARLSDMASELKLHEPSLGRLLRALASMGVVDRGDAGWALTPLGELLRDGGLGAGMRAWAELVAGQYLTAWSGMAHSLRTGESAFAARAGQSAWEHRQRNPHLDDAFGRLTRVEQTRAVTGLKRAYDFRTTASVADIGGGQGLLLAGLLQSYPAMRGVLFDQPHAVEAAAPFLRQAGVLERCRLVGGSFLEQSPPPAEIYLLKHVLHNWDDATCLVILGNLAGGLERGGKLLLLENVLPEDDLKTPLPQAMLDLYMLAVLGGRERKLSEYVELLEGSGWVFSRRLFNRPGAPDILEARLRQG